MATSNHLDISPNRWDLFKNRNFRMLWASQAVSQIGDGLTKVALLWFVYQLTGSALKMTIIGLLQTIPPLVLSPIVGVYLDRLPKKPVMVILDVIRAFLILLIPVLYFFDALTLEVLFILVFFTAIFSTAFGPALAASLPLLVKPSELMSANSLLQSTTNVGILIGPAICGVLIAWLGTQNVLYVDAATFLLSALCLLPIKGHLLTTAPRMANVASKVSQDLAVGMQFVFREKPILRALLIITVCYTLGASAFIYVLPLFVTDHIEADPRWLGWLWSAMGAGMLATSFGLSCVKNLGLNNRIFLIAISMVAGGVALQFLAHSHSVVWGFILVTLIGASTAAFTPIAWSIIQETTPSHLMGRVFTLINTASMAMASGGMVAFGGVADNFGSMAGISMIGFVFLVTGMVVILLNRSSFQGERLLPWKKMELSAHQKRIWSPVRISCSKPLSILKSRRKNYPWMMDISPYSSDKTPNISAQRGSRAPPWAKKIHITIHALFHEKERFRMKHHSRDLLVMSLVVTLIPWSQVFGLPTPVELVFSAPEEIPVFHVQDHQVTPSPKRESSEKAPQKPSDKDNIVQSQNLSLKLAFMEDPRLFPYDIDCQIQEKTVELRGEVSVAEEKTIVTAITTNLIKGKEIINHIEVRPFLRAAIQAKMDARLTELVKQRFAHSQTLREADFEIMTIRGVVSLSGRSRFQVIVLEGAQAAREIPGVIAVNSQNVRLEAGND